MTPDPIPFSIDDLYLHHKVTELHGLASLQQVAAVVRTVDRDSDSYRAQLWICPLDGGAPWQLTNGGGLDSAPRWSPQGDRLAFISTRDGSPQLHLIAADGGEASACGAATSGVSALRWLPDGRSLLLSVMLDVEPELRGRRGQAPPAPRPARPELAWRLPYKVDGSGYSLGREVHLFHFDPATGTRRQISDGAFDVHGFEPSPDGTQIAYVRHREGRFAHRTDLWLCDIDGGNHRQLTSELATVMQPAWSPDCRQLAFSGAPREGEARSGLYLLDLAGGSVRRLADAALEVAALADAVQWSVASASSVPSLAPGSSWPTASRARCCPAKSLLVTCRPRRRRRSSRISTAGGPSARRWRPRGGTSTCPTTTAATKASTAG